MHTTSKLAKAPEDSGSFVVRGDGRASSRPVIAGGVLTWAC